MIFKHISEVVVGTHFSPCGRFRYRLTIDRKDIPKGRVVCAILQNPSVADSEFADKSVQFIEKLIFLKEYEEFKNVSRIIIVNQFALVQTKDFEGESDHIGIENDTFIEQALDEADIVLIAWGAANPYKKRQKAIHDKLLKHTRKKIFKTKAHPSRGTYKDFIERIPSSTDFSSVEASADAKGKERYSN